MRTWLTADTHFGHKNIVKYCDRPFFDVDAMDEAMVVNWNSVVADDDIVYHLGDVAWRDAEGYLSRLRGRKVVVRGNHDSRRDLARLQRRGVVEAVHDYLEVEVDGKKLVLFHYPINDWSGAAKGSYHFYGHVHARKLPRLRSCDVGVDAWNFAPVLVERATSYLDEVW